ncbi:hypothetical protein TUMSATVNIG1_19020 [Vibrio nigripulchritudo]|nr:hypothetical protein TUMSATVNIG1_19020 [Vibrio nigripulchritudo]
MNVNHLLQQKQKRWKKSFLISAIALVFLSLAYLSIGEVFISPFNYLEPLNNMLLTELRLPRLFAALAIGSALAISGASLQVLLGNSLAEPGVLGISGGASLAMVVVLFLLPVMPTPEVSMLSWLSLLHTDHRGHGEKHEIEHAKIAACWRGTGYSVWRCCNLGVLLQ